MTSFIIFLIITISVAYIIKLWVDYKKVAVNAPNYDKVTAITWLLFAFMAMTGISSLSEQLTNYLFSMVGLEAPVHFVWKALFAYLVFVIAVVLILTKGKKEVKEQVKHTKVKQGVGEINADVVMLEQHFHSSENNITPSKQPIKEVQEPIKTTPKPLPHTSKTKLFGRTKEFGMLTRAWNNNKQNIVVLKAMGGTGKTALLKHWINGFHDESKRTEYDEIFQWSFYSQGSAEDKQASADGFFDKALMFFGYEGDVIGSAHDKGMKLAELVNKQRTLLVLDGLEPLQHPISIMRGELKDKGLQSLLRELAVTNQGLCLISSRQEVVELVDKPLVLAYDLGRLETDDGIDLLKSYGVYGAKKELQSAVEEVVGHALALNLLGNYVKVVLDGDIRKRDTIKELNAEREEGNHAQKVMAAYEIHLKDTPALSILYMMGLFDRPVSTSVLQHLRDAKISQLTEHLADETEWKYALDDLRKQQLLNANDASHPNTLDTHPLIREYFGKRLKETAPKAWQQAHALLYDYYKAVPKNEQPDSLEEMEPLFTAIGHGCAAGMAEEALLEVYWARIRRENDNYLCNKLGAFGADLSVLAYFFSQHWQIPAAELTDNAKAGVLNWAAFRLGALGRLNEAEQPLKVGLKMHIKQENWREATNDSVNLSELKLTRGEACLAIETAQESMELANKSNYWSSEILALVILADSQHQVGELTQAQYLFKQAEALQEQWDPEYPQLYALSGFRYCDLLLSEGQWQKVQQRTTRSLDWQINHFNFGLFSMAVDKISLGRANLQQAIESATPVLPIEKNMVLDALIVIKETTLDREALVTAKDWLDKAVEGLRNAGVEDYLTRGLLSRASYFRFYLGMGEDEVLVSALADLHEAHDIAQRGGMLLHLCDYHLESARLAVTIEKTVHGLSASEHIQEAKNLIEQTGYKRRLPEVKYLERFIGS